MTINPQIFKSYDVRGVYPADFNEEIAKKIVKAYIKLYKPQKVVLGRDVRESGESLHQVSLASFLEAGVDVIDIGIVSTDMFYFAVGQLPVDGGITISASHNPREWNGMNFCKKGAEPISSETGLFDIRDLVIKNDVNVESENKGSVEKKDISEDFLRRVASFIDLTLVKPTKIVANANFGMDVILLNKAISMFNLPLTVIPLNAEPDGSFPKGPPNPLLPQNRKEFLDLLRSEKADLGVSWDGDGDRCFFADETATFIEGYFITALLATEVLKKHPGAKIIIDPRLVWATQEAIINAGGTPVICKPGMTIIADRMKKERAVFGGEMSSHFYFKENYNRDNGMIPLFLILEMLSKYNTTLSQLVAPYTSKYFISGELNFETEKKDEIIQAAHEKYEDGKIEFIDGLSVEYQDWRFNLRKSNTEPLLRLNLEARSREKMEEKKSEAITFIESFGAKPH
ncbi:MAG: phosphomannomutase/phosphoglucomutase [Candidatus Levybacteria bacterium]|nr:phosphomannomutase/phosphoglucomutase [Candidatus Levybacteria bacterium]